MTEITVGPSVVGIGLMLIAPCFSIAQTAPEPLQPIEVHRRWPLTSYRYGDIPISRAGGLTATAARAGDPSVVSMLHRASSFRSVSLVSLVAATVGVAYAERIYTLGPPHWSQGLRVGVFAAGIGAIGFDYLADRDRRSAVERYNQIVEQQTGALQWEWRGDGVGFAYHF